MFDIVNRSTCSVNHVNGEHIFNVLELNSSEFDNLKSDLVSILPSQYIDPNSIADVLSRLGKDAAAQKLRDKIPIVKKIRSGDIGELLTADYIQEETDFMVPIKKLRWRDHRDMAMRGDDVIGIFVNPSDQSVRFLKAEAKSYQSLSTAVLNKAREELDNDGGLPAPHALAFVIDRLKEIRETTLANLLEKVQLVDGINANQVEHLLFTFTSSNPATLQRTAFDNYNGNIKQTSIGFKVDNHQRLISEVYQGVIDANNS